MKSRISLLILLLLLFARCLRPAAAQASTQPQINVILWFDTEDYLLPADDDATKRLAEMLSERGIRATFKLVGEKARVLEKRGRRDVIATLKKHDIGYHANYHSVHPTPSEYLADCELLDGIEEFARREGGGAADVRRILGVDTLSCYGQPGSSWGAQTIAGLRYIGVAPHGTPCYVDEGTHVGLNEKPFWYAGALVVYHMGANYTRMDLHDAAAVEPGKQKFTAIADRLRKEDGGGLISIFYHPCEWVHLEFWDGVNFRRGANPPREEWKPPPQRPAEETEAAFQRFAQYIDHIKSTSGVHFVTASDLPELYPDPTRTQGASESDLKEMAARLLQPESKGVDFLVLNGKSYSVADQFEIFTSVVGTLIDNQKLHFPVRTTALLGPDNVPPPPASERGSVTRSTQERGDAQRVADPRSGPEAKTNLQVAWPAFRDATLDVRDYLQKNGRVPARVFIGPDAVPPADFLVGLASVVHSYFQEAKLAIGPIRLGINIELLPARQVAKDTPGLFGGWIIHREGFRAPKILEVARLQAWTLKPAIPRKATKD